MATKRPKNSEEEKLDSANMEKVIRLLEPADDTKPISKKDACAILNISYNTTRLGKLIEAYKEKKTREAERRAAKRGTSATIDEVQHVIQEYLEGTPVDKIADSIYRSQGFVRNILEAHAVPLRPRSQDYFKPELIPEGAMRTRFTVGEKVYSARYNSVATVEAESVHKSGQYVYRIWLLAEKWKQYAYQEACELASLEHLTKLGVRI